MAEADTVYFDTIHKKPVNGKIQRVLDRLNNIKNIEAGVEREADKGQRTSVEEHFLRSLGNDIAPIPECRNPERRLECSTSFKLFCESYFPARFYMQWSPTHIESLGLMQSAVVNGGGYYALAEPRGGGKTSRAECLALWALFYSYRRFVVCVGATAGHSVEMYKSILTEIETNPILMADFPEVCYPIQCLNGSYMRARMQHVAGQQTRLEIRADSLVFPYIEDENGVPLKTAGSAIQCVSITGRIRGIKRTVVNTGEILRPDFVIVDDPQTDKSAKSPKQVDTRERTIMGTICGLAGPQSSITAVMPCTVIQSNDLAERFLDQERRPEWQGRRTAMMPKFPDNLDLWKEYAEIQAQSFRDGRNGVDATEFYKLHRAEMDAGAEVSWNERYNPKTELSAIQAAMNLWIKDPKAFASEYQNKPLIESNSEANKIELDAKAIMNRLSMLSYRTVPRETQYLTTGIDIQQRILYYVTCAWIEDFGGSIVDYGTFPEQPGSEYFNAQNPSIPLEKVFPDYTLGPQVFAGLEQLRSVPLNRLFVRDEVGEEIKVERSLVDANWNMVADAVYSFCKENESKFSPSHGKGLVASSLPMESWTKKQGEKIGDGWRIRLSTVGSGRGRHTLIDTNFWKSRIAERLSAPKGSSNCITLYGSKSYHHQMIADHLASEYSVLTTGRGRSVNEWKLKGGNENHYFDCLVMSAVAASQAGLKLHEKVVETDGSKRTAAIKRKTREPLDLSKIGKQ